MIPISLQDAARFMGATCSVEVGDAVVRRITTDSRDVHPGDLFFALRGLNADGHRFVAEAASKGAVACVVDERSADEVASASYPGRPAPLLFVDDTVAALGRLGARYRSEVMDPTTVVVAVTGSNGKTTTKQMIDHVLGGSLAGRAAPKSFNNKIGVPLTLLSSEPGDRYLVVEIGTNAPGEVAALAALASPQVGVITSIAEAHLEGLGTVVAVAEEKASLLDHVSKNGLAVVNVDREEIHSQLGRAHGKRLITFGFDVRAHRRVETLEAGLRGTRMVLDGRFAIDLPMPGPHHATNAAATFIVAQWFGLSAERIAERLATFQPSEGRTRVVDVGGVTIVDDAYNANPGSMAGAIAAVRSIASRRRVFVMGDMAELGPRAHVYHERAVRTLVEAGVEVLVAVGPASIAAAESLGASGGVTRTVRCDDAVQACEAMALIVQDGDVVWIKGSRSMGLDRVVAALQARVRPCAAVA